MDPRDWDLGYIELAKNRRNSRSRATPLNRRVNGSDSRPACRYCWRCPLQPRPDTHTWHRGGRHNVGSQSPIC